MFRVFLVVALAAVSIGITSAYASSGTGPRGGEAVGGISGYAVSDVRFSLGPGASVEAVDFRLAPSGAHSVRVRLAANGAWLACMLSAGRASCPLPAGTGAAALDQLSVVAS